jgi:SAM-dependent methyltransferase
MRPFGVPEIVAAVAGAERVLDAGCGSARLTLALAEAGAAEVVGIDTSRERLAQAAERVATHAGVEVRLADFDAPLPFGDGRFAATVSRLALMIAQDPTATLRELARVTVRGGRTVTALWAPVGENPWFVLPRSAAAAVLGPGRAEYARAFGRIGDPEQAAELHRAAGLTDVRAQTLRETLEPGDVAAWWTWLAREIGHVRRLDEGLTAAERAAILDELAGLAAEYRRADGSLGLPRAITLVTARTAV